MVGRGANNHRRLSLLVERAISQELVRSEASALVEYHLGGSCASGTRYVRCVCIRGIRILGRFIGLRQRQTRTRGMHDHITSLKINLRQLEPSLCYMEIYIYKFTHSKPAIDWVLLYQAMYHRRNANNGQGLVEMRSSGGRGACRGIA